MPRLARLEGHRFIGVRDTMTVHDCDAPRQMALLRRRMDEEDLLGRKLIQTFAPDTLAEARNRGFRSA